MTDKEYINGFYGHNDSVITNFYLSKREKFCGYFMKKYKKSEDYVIDLFTDTIIVLQNNIENQKLTADGLTSSLDTYLYAIGHRTLWAQDRKANVFGQISLEGSGTVNDEGEEYISKDIYAAIEKLERDGVLDAKVNELQDFVDRMVHSMKSPCSELLDLFYWGKKTMEEIAEKMSFTNANSAKSQKYKCIQKLRPLIEQFQRI